MTAVTMSALLNLIIMFLCVGICFELKRWMKVVRAELDTHGKAIRALFNANEVLADKIILLRKQIK